MSFALKVPEVKSFPIASLGIQGIKPLLGSQGEVKQYNQVSCLDTLLSADNIISRWQYDRRLIAKAIKIETLADPWTSIISKDNACLCGLNQQGRAFTSPGACVGCNVLSRLFNKGEVVLDTATLIQAGHYTGVKISIHKFKRGVDTAHGLVGYENKQLPAILGAQLLTEFASMQACENTFSSHVQDTSFWACKGSMIEHYILVSCFLENALRKMGFSTLPTFRWVYECRGDMNVIEEIPNLGRGSLEKIITNPDYRSPALRAGSEKRLELNPDTCRGILLQLISTLHFYNRYAVTHGSPCIQNLGFSRAPAAYMYEDVRISSPITLHVIPSGTTSLSTFSGDNKVVRVYHPGASFNQSVDYKLLPRIEVSSFLGLKHGEAGAEVCVAPSVSPTPSRPSSGEGLFTVPCLPEYLRMRTIGYKIGSNTASFTTYVRHLGIPLFHSSFDLYAFWTALMCEEPFYLAVSNDRVILDIWKQLFDPSYYNDLMKDIQAVHRRASGSPSLGADQIVTLLSKYFLRCDALDYTWARIQTTFR